MAKYIVGFGLQSEAYIGPIYIVTCTRIRALGGFTYKEAMLIAAQFITENKTF